MAGYANCLRKIKVFQYLGSRNTKLWHERTRISKKRNCYTGRGEVNLIFKVILGYSWGTVLWHAQDCNSDERLDLKKYILESSK